MLSNTLYAASTYLPNIVNDYIKENKKPREKVYVVGNGWATYYFVKNLNKFKYEPIVVAPNARVLNTPKLVDRIFDPNIAVDFPNPYCEHISDIVDDIELDNKELVTKSGTKFPYGRVVFAIGSEPNDFGIRGVNEHTYKFKTILDADTIGKKLNSDMGLNSSIYIVGSGITGIELGSKIEQGLFEVKIIEGLGTILQGLNDKTKLDIEKYFLKYNLSTQIKLSHMVKSIDSNIIRIEIPQHSFESIDVYGKVIWNPNMFDPNIIEEKYNPDKQMIIWTGGVRFNGFGKTQLFHTLNSIKPIKPRGLEVEQNFSFGANDDIYCLGDMVGNMGPPTAQNAKNQAIWLAGYFNSDFDAKYEKLSPYKVKSNGKLIHLANGTYLESKYYSGFIPDLVVKLIELFD